ncbi:maltose permease MAL31 [Corynespora cassiicola Philippines]|uniref:Maltose permease MAL31 n=1 Tax=Corynespora cassiicola Philippines TaxID=1448308 RepID=A0A2T2PDA4_CORCC|nr:maltose permease MAL31 [Corynespora cassiicola Philippines]
MSSLNEKNNVEKIAAHATDFEDHEATIWQTLRRNPWATFWSLYACWTIILVAFETQAGGAVVGIPQFRKDFGYEYPIGSGSYVIPASWQSAFSGAPSATKVIACLFTGQLADWIGRRYTLLISLIIAHVAIGVEFVATTNAVFFAGKLVQGFSIGIVATMMVAYVGEIAPLKLRGILTCCIGVAYGIGPLTAFIIINYTGDVETRWAYRTIFCSQWGFAAVATILWPWMPESPWWLVSKDKNDQALKSLHKLGYTGERGQQRLALVQVTLEEVKKETEGVTYAECFRKSNLRRTIISIMPMNIQSLSGIAFVAGYFTYYLQLAGYSTSQSFQIQIAQPVLSIVGNLMAAAVVDRVGRRSLTLYGNIILTSFLLITGGLGTNTTDLSMIRGTVAFILIYSWWYNVSLGSVAFSILAEVSTSRLRYKTVAIGLATSSAINVMWQFTIPYMFNPDQANLGAKIAFIFGGLCLFCIAYLFFYQPETAGRSYAELDEMFAKGVPARKFKSYRTTMEIQNEAAAEMVTGKQV